jgi:predicted peroxiredoxin
MMASDEKVLVGITTSEPEDVLLAYLTGVEALRAGKQATFWLTKDAIHVATDGAAESMVVPDAPDTRELHDEFVERGGRFLVCPVCVKLRGLGDNSWSENTTVAGLPAVYEYTSGGALVFNY